MRTLLVATVTGLIALAGGCCRQNEPDAGMAYRQAALRYTQAAGFLSDVELRDGVYYMKGETNPLSGVAIKLSLEGHRLKETHFRDGKLDGPQTQWDHNGNLLAVTVFEENRVACMREYGERPAQAPQVPETESSQL